MTSKPHIHALIPARGGSVSIPKKNLAELDQRPLLSYPIRTALRSRLIERVVVSTDCTQIASVARAHGAEVPFMRPAEFATNESTDLEVFLHYLEWLQEQDQHDPVLIVHLRATAPLRDAATVDNAIQTLLQRPDATALRSISDVSFPPYKMWRIDSGGVLQPVIDTGIPNYCDSPRQVFPATFQQDGYIDIVRPEIVRDSKSMGGKRILAFQHDTPNNDIDQPRDLHEVQTLLGRDYTALRWRVELGRVRFGIIQGRLSPSPTGALQVFPTDWQAELKALHSSGLSFIELLWDTPSNKNNPLNAVDNGASIKHALTKYGVAAPVVCTDLPIETSLIETSGSRIAEAIPALTALGMRKLVLPLMGESQPDDNNLHALGHSIASLAKITSLYQARLCIEPMCPLAELERLLSATGRDDIELCLDTGNLFNLGIDPVKFLTTFGNRITHVHLKDRNTQGDNVMLGQGEVDFSQVFHALLEHNYTGDFTFECPRGDNPIETCKRHVAFATELLERTFEERYR